MPILNIQLAAQLPDGNPLPPLVALQQRGPVVQVTVSVEQNSAQQRLAQGVTLPSPESGLALIDTGATSTCIDDGAAARLDVPAIDVVTAASASHAAPARDVPPMSIAVVGPPSSLRAPRPIAAPLAPPGLEVRMGRDVRQHWRVFRAGPAGAFSRSV